jgi:hypothetical protein
MPRSEIEEGADAVTEILEVADPLRVADGIVATSVNNGMDVVVTKSGTFFGGFFVPQPATFCVISCANRRDVPWERREGRERKGSHITNEVTLRNVKPSGGN